MSEESHPAALLQAIRSQGEVMKSMDGKLTDIARAIPTLSDRVKDLEVERRLSSEFMKDHIIPFKERTERRVNRLWGGISVLAILGALIITTVMSLVRAYTKMDIEREALREHPLKEQK